MTDLYTRSFLLYYVIRFKNYGNNNLIILTGHIKRQGGQKQILKKMVQQNEFNFPMLYSIKFSNQSHYLTPLNPVEIILKYRFGKRRALK